jgi:hypothetical protein
VVRKGQILAGGVIDTDNNGVRVTRAAGEVWARTRQTYTVRVPFEAEEKVYSGREWSEISLLFFSLDRKVLKTTGKMVESCDIIEEIKWLSVGEKTLPVGIALTRYREYTLQTVRITAKEACDKAYAVLQKMLYEESAARRVLSRQTEMTVDGESVTLICTVIAEENIAAVSELASGE